MLQYLREKLRSLFQSVFGGPGLVPIELPLIPDTQIHIPDLVDSSYAKIKEQIIDSEQLIKEFPAGTRLQTALDEYYRLLDSQELKFSQKKFDDSCLRKQENSGAACQPGASGFVMR